ncbi:MAG TPA: preprotein translocase subunit SecE [Myxococcaceae bacterium]|nr:preprotein translocase subunit SecE [Myxococcaceae bacterium]
MAMDEASQQANRAGMDPNRLVVIFYLIAGIIFGLFLEHVLALAFAGAGWGDREMLEGLGWRVSTVLGFVLSAALAVFCFVRLKALNQDVASELMKVSWPSWEETRVATVAVVVASLVASVVLFGIDTLAYKLMVEWLPAVWGKL